MRTGRRPVRNLLRIVGAVAAVVAAPLSLPAVAHAAVVAPASGRGIDDFYAIRGGAPLWFDAGQPTAAAQELLTLLDSANIDGLQSSKYQPDSIRTLLAKASAGNSAAVRKADYLLSNSFVQYASDLRNVHSDEMKYVDPALPSGVPSPRALLLEAASAPSLTRFIAGMGWMNPDYASLRRALVSGEYANDHQRDLLRINLQRARVLPAGVARYIIVNAAAQRLYMYDHDRPVDSMRVVVGQQKADRKTPMMAGYLRYASLNPYWNVPPDLVWDDVGKYVKQYGLGYLKSRRYDILSDWTDDATVVDPKTIDWKAVKDGTIQIRVRQNPGPRNVLGKVKYTFSNPFGVYLHDTSNPELLTEDTRLFSGGCIRLEDASRLGEWLFGHKLVASSDAPDIKVPLAQPVPVYVTYLTAIPDGKSITFLDDVYDWDSKRLAAMDSGGGQVAAR